MKILERYETILEQSLAELGPVQIPTDRDEAQVFMATYSAELGDILYRLTIEHGMPFGPFRETVLGIITDQTDTSGSNRAFAADLERMFPLIQLALEIMPAEAPDL